MTRRGYEKNQFRKTEFPRESSGMEIDAQTIVKQYISVLLKLVGSKVLSAATPNSCSCLQKLAVFSN